MFGQDWGVALPPETDPELAKWWEDKFRKVVATKAWQDGLAAKFQRSEFIGLDGVKAHNTKMQDIYRTLMTDSASPRSSRSARRSRAGSDAE